MKEEITVFGLPVYNYQITVVVSEDVEASRIERNGIMEEKYLGGPAAGIHSSLEESGESYIFLTPDADFSTIVHECFHCTSAVMTTIGSFLDEASEEVYAYTLGYITERVASHVKYSKRKLKRK